MVKGTLQMSLDLSARKDVPHEVVSYQHDGRWMVVKRGPKYSNHYLVTDFDAVGLIWLRSKEQKPE